MAAGWAGDNRVLISRDTLLVIIFFCVCMLIELPIFSPHMRKIPMQRLVYENGTAVILPELLLDNPYVPKDEQIVPTALLFALCVVIPLGFLALVSWFEMKPGDPASFVRGLLMAFGCMIVNVNFIKLYVGYLRPYFYEECQFDRTTGECLGSSLEGRKSFPSGHSSASFCAMLFTSLYLLGKVAQMPSKTLTTPLGNVSCTNALLLFALSPVMLAFWVAASRVRENDHHPADVVTGGCIGSAWAVMWYVRYFTRLWDDRHDESSDCSAVTIETTSHRGVAGDEDLPMTAA
eukprot:symbB.v1.2.036163.t1/scaffold5039.1/size31583/1